jgi:septal ring factor EnvC (AmiA/AmiB activator)
MTLLALLSTLVAVALLVALTYYATRIAHALEAIGAREPSTRGRYGQSPSALSRIWFGVNAIEKQLSALPPQVTRLNDNLGELAEALARLKASLKSTLDTIEAQRG